VRKRDPHRFSSTDPQIVHHSKDKKVFGVFDSIVTNQWYSGGVDTRARVNGLGKVRYGSAQNGPIEAVETCCVAQVSLATL
jgi:hypothetical protein